MVIKIFVMLLLRLTKLNNMKLLLLTLITVFTLISGCSKNPRTPDKISETQKQREVCLDWYGYRIDTGKAISDLDLKVETESELMAYCEFFKNVADTK